MKRIVDHHSPYWLAALLLTVGRATDVEANPTGLSIGSGSASLQQLGAQLNINVSSAAAVLNWQSFNIGAGETTRFIQPSQNSVVLNLIGGASPSQIFGNLTANGTVILANGNGFYFGPNSFVSVGGSFIATTAPQPQDLGGGAGWQFTGMPPLASIVNYGQISVGAGKSLYLIAENIENQGGLSAPGGSIDLAAGQDVLVSETPDGRGLSATVKLPAGSVDNFGRVTADGGSIAVQAQVVNQNGILQADSIQNQNGVIELVASDMVNLGPNSQLLARGDATAGGSVGGDVIIKSDNIFSDTTGSQIVTTGGTQGGNGGNVEVSAANILSLDSAMDGSVTGSGTAGQLLLDPINITLTGSGTTTSSATPNSGGTVNGSASSSGNWNVNVNTAFLNKNFSQITLEASGNITLSANLAWNLSASTGLNAGGLSLLAGGDILFGSGSKITDANLWSVNLEAGYNFLSHNINASAGNIYLNGGNAGTGNGSIATAGGNISLLAGKSIQLGSGSVAATDGNILGQTGGDITLVGTAAQITDSGAGSVALAAGYDFTAGKVVTGNGNIYLNGGNGKALKGSILTGTGNLTLQAGNNIQLGIGTVSAGGGNETWLAGGDITIGSSGASVIDNGNGSVTLKAGYDFSGQTVQSGSGNIYLNNSSSGTVDSIIETAGGDIHLEAGISILAGMGSAFTTGGGNLFAEAISGDINTGLWPGGPSQKTITSDLNFSSSGSTPNTILGGFSTAAGGNVTLIAGNNIDSTPKSTGKWPGESGAYGAGNVTVTAGNQITGNYLLTDGVGTLAGANIGESSAPILLSLIAGTWNVTAANDLYLNEVNNPNGTYTSPGFQFNYAPDAAVNLWAGNAITLEGGVGPDGAGTLALPRTQQNGSMLPIYAPELNLNAGAGGIHVENSLILFPSIDNNLTITTRDGGSLIGQNGSEITMSDSAYTYYNKTANDFTGNNATVPVQLNDPNGPVKVNVTGDWTGLGLILPEAAEINVVGNLTDSSLQAWNLHSTDTTTINVGAAAKQAMEQSGVLTAGTDGGLAGGGDINLNGNQLKVSGPGAFNINAGTVEMDGSASIIAGEAVTPGTSVLLPNILTAADFNDALSSNPDLAAKLQYDATTGRLTFAGAISPAEQSALLTALGSTEAAALQQLYTENQKDMLGANLNLTTSGNLTMTMTTAIVNYGLLGNISLNIGDTTGGTVTIGNNASDAATQTQPTAGIFTSSGGDVSVISGGTISVGQSRIATYDGGNVTVLALNGNIDCGVGSLGVTYVNNAYELDPTTGQLVDLLAALGSNLGGGLGFGIPGSGIRANTFVNGNARLGNMLVEAPNGKIDASEGGIVALHFNSLELSHAADSVMDIFAGYELENLAGQPLSAADLAAGQTFKNITLTPTPAHPYKYADLLDAAGTAIGQLIRVKENQDITATGSGIIGQIINAQATGEISGLLSGREVSVTAPQIGSLVVFSHDTPVISGTSLNGADPVIVSPTQDTAAPAAAAMVAEAPNADNASTVATKTQLAGDDTADEEAKKRGKGKGIGLAQKVSRVTVLLPAKY